jgi:phosphoglycolate phosphatase
LPPAVVFDLDGTLVDSVGDIAAALNRSFADEGLGQFDIDAVKAMVGGGSRRTLERALASLGEPARPERLDRLVARFEQHYAAEPCRHTQLFPGAIELLDRLAASNVRRGLCTNKTQAVTASLLSALGLEHRLDAVVAARDDLPKKPDPAMLRLAFDKLGATPADGIMFGDSSTDVACARNAGCRVLLVSFGYTKVPARELGADAVVDDFDSAIDALCALVAPAGAGRA